MGIRDILFSESPSFLEEEPDPDWMETTSPTKRKIFAAAKAELTRISQLLQVGRPDNIKDKRLCPGKIARIAGASRSYISRRRLPELCDWIERKNRFLVDLEKQNRPGRKKYSPKSKRELESEITRLTQLNKQQTEDYLRHTVESIFFSNSLDDRDVLARQNSKLRADNQQLLDKMARLESDSRSQLAYIGRVIAILTPQQKAELSNFQLME